VPGFPIRTPSDQRSVDSSPRTIAASHVLHRLLVPRHPPCALDNLTNTHIKKSRHKCAQKQKMLASTVQFSTTTRTSTHHPAPAENGRRPSPRKQPTAETARSSPQDPTVCQPPNRPQANPRATSVSPLFLEQPHSHTQPTDNQQLSRYSGPSTTSSRSRRTLACTPPPPTVSGEAP
jgi:hypothetical protein